MVNIKPLGVGVIFPVLGVVGFYFSMSFLFKTGCIDSGIVPRALPDEIAYMQSQGDEGKYVQYVTTETLKLGSLEPYNTHSKGFIRVFKVCLASAMSFIL